MLAGALTAGFFAFVLGFLLARYRGIFFGLLSLALSMILYGLLVKSEALGSTDGFNILPRRCSVCAQARSGCATRFSPAPPSLPGLALVVHRYLAHAARPLAPAIKDNEIRVEYMGASARRAVHVKYVIAAVLAGVGGALAATTVGHIDPADGVLDHLGEFIFITILAGTGQRARAVRRRAALRCDPHHRLRPLAQHLADEPGLSLLLIIVFLPEGLWSLFKKTCPSFRRAGIEQDFRRGDRGEDVSAAIEKDSVVGLIGTNGAGKTTFINMITGYLKPDTGSIAYEGRDITRLPPRAITRLGSAARSRFRSSTARSACSTT